MQRAPQPTRAAAGSSTTRAAPSSTLLAKTSLSSAVPAAHALVQGSTRAIPTSAMPRRALQPLDCNRTHPPAAPPSDAVAKAPFAYVSRFHRPSSSATSTVTSGLRTTTTASSSTTSLMGLKRKQHDLEQIVADHHVEDEEEQTRENLAWLDMLVALLERKYQRYAAPVCVDDLERAKLLDAYWSSTSTPETKTSVEASGSANKRSRLSPTTSAATVKSEGYSSTTSNSSTIAPAQNPKDEKEEKEEKRVRRHAQQIQDTSVASTSCCGCKTGCLKMYCVCFSTRGYCHEGCTCGNCKNSRASADQRLEAITTYLSNDPRAFSYAASASGSLAHGGAAGFFQLLPEKSSTVVLRGCRCKKSKCLKKYCECFQNGLGCGPHCRCVECANDASPAAREMRAKNKSDQTAESSSSKPTTATASTTTASTTTSGAFHAIKVAVTKKPRRNCVLKSVRLRL